MATLYSKNSPQMFWLKVSCCYTCCSAFAILRDSVIPLSLLLKYRLILGLLFPPSLGLSAAGWDTKYFSMLLKTRRPLFLPSSYFHSFGFPRALGKLWFLFTQHYFKYSKTPSRTKPKNWNLTRNFQRKNFNYQAKRKIRKIYKNQGHDSKTIQKAK